MITIKILGDEIEVTTSDSSVFSLTLNALDDLQKAIQLIQELPQTTTFNGVEIKIQ